MNELKQNFYKYVTTPIARALDFINIPKRIKIKKRQKKLAFDNMCSYIETTSRLLFEQDLQQHADKGEFPHPLMIPLIIAKNIARAEEMFEAKKKNGDFDELNIMVR